jgi:hypothetical protein
MGLLLGVGFRIEFRFRIDVRVSLPNLSSATDRDAFGDERGSAAHSRFL